ncbi:MAG: hypothetical protein ABR974_06365 [Bacteroidales bacterium]|jgi:hypothetical protein
MKIKLYSRDTLWMVIGTLVLLLALILVWHFQTGHKSIEQLALKARRVNIVAQMRLDLTSASEAEKSAVLAITDQDSKTFADQTRMATLKVEQEKNELGELLAREGTRSEKELIAQFSVVFKELQLIDNDLLTLAIRNTNIKAYSLAFGPASDALREMDTALSSLVAKSASYPEARDIALHARGAQISAWHIQSLLAPHIAEESDKKMDEFEVQMTREDHEVRRDLSGLAVIQEFRGSPDLKSAVSDYTRFSDIRVRILALSRENTNVQSLSISLGQKRMKQLQCQEVLSALQQAISEEPEINGNYGYVFNPRNIQGDNIKEK